MEQFGIGNGAEFQSQNRVIKSPGYSGFQITIAPDKAAYCVFTQFRGPENAIKLISVRTKTQ